MRATGTRLEAPAPESVHHFSPPPTPSLPVPPMNITRMDSVTLRPSAGTTNRVHDAHNHGDEGGHEDDEHDLLAQAELPGRCAALSSSSHWALNFTILVGSS